MEDNNYEQIDRSFDEGLEFEDDGGFDFEESLEEQEAPISASDKLASTSSSNSMKHYIEVSLGTDKSISLQPEELELVTGIEFKSQVAISKSQELKDQILDGESALNETITYMKTYRQELLKAKLAFIDSHINSVKQVCEKTQRNYLASLDETRKNVSKMQSNIASFNADGKQGEQSLLILQERLRALEANRLTQLRGYRRMGYRTKLVIDFLNAYKEMYKSIHTLEIQNDTSKYGLLRDLDYIGDNKVRVRCSCCNHTFEINEADLPHLNIGKAYYEIDVMHDLLDMYDTVCAQSLQYDKVCTQEVYDTLKRCALANGKREIVNQADTYHFLTDRVAFFAHNRIQDDLQKQDANAYARCMGQLFPRIGNDPRVIFERFITQTLVIPNIQLNDPTTKSIFSNIAVPTLLNVLRNRHPLMMRHDIDEININSLSANIPSCAFEHAIVSDRAKIVMDKLEDNFLYPNPAMEYMQTTSASDATQRQSQNARLNGVMRMDRLSPLRLKLKDIQCPECQAKLLLYHPVLTAMRTYMLYFVQKSDILTDLDTLTTVNLKPLMAPIAKSKPKPLNDIFERAKNKNRVSTIIKPSDKRIINTASAGTTIETTGVKRSELADTQGIIAQLRQEKGLVSDILATRYHRAELEGNTLEMAEVMQENQRILTERNAEAQSKAELAMLQNLAQEIATLAKENRDEELRVLINERAELIAKARNYDQPFATAMIELVDSFAPAEPVEKTLQDYLDEYGDVDLDTLSYEELTSKGLYNYENALKVYGMKESDCDCVEAVFIRIMDEAGRAELPKALQDSINSNYTFVDGIPAEMAASGMVFI